ncbi:penicillin-binding protein [Aminipila butyrica]|uniref:Penicillin-binding protein n=1 Tax=Aminipila butyrica TaxID=433296 RepID=A0A858BX16_9FIRM|nr:penicillin-binding transpeptidase domain-containing protein [Aminipila butyrica]QIB69635.1 penicillin-binding protein [Aminipila butyrica]
MKKITSRTIVCFLLALVLVAGTVLFTFKFFAEGNTWSAFSANRHLYTRDVLNTGRILDRDGNVLADYDESSQGWTYGASSSLHKATLHAVGDSSGMIGTGAMTRFADKLTGYNVITGAKPIFPGGRDLYLTLDADVCQTAYKALNGRKGTVGVYNYKTGQIICMVSAPTYDPADKPTIKDDDHRYEGVYINRLLSATFIPGSTFKLVTAAAALEQIDGIQERTFHCTGQVTIGDQVITCPTAHGDLTLGQALAASCNCTFGQLAAELGSEQMESYVKKVGLTGSLSVNGIQTAKSTFDFVSGGQGELAWSGIGQGKDLVNPCAMMVYSGAIAGGGTAAKPQIISHTAFTKGVRTSLYLKHSTKEFISPDTAATLADMMRNNVITNYGQSNFPGLSIGAKSGTAQSDHSDEDNAWFTGFLQDEKHPYAFVVLVEGGGSGSKVAGSVANAVLQAAVKAD